MDKGFVGGTKDSTGLTHLGARYYDPAIGRFLSVDPVIDPADPQQLHACVYAHNNPINKADPYGLWPGWLDSAASTVASAASSAGNWAVNTATNIVESVKEDPLKFATGVVVGIAVGVAIAGVCATGVGCVILAGTLGAACIRL
jgi:RHS repeat-associated protein